MSARYGGGGRLSDLVPQSDIDAASLMTPGETLDTVLDFEMPASDIARLLRAPALRTRRHGRARSMAAGIVWHDTADGDLAAAGLSLSSSKAEGSSSKAEGSSSKAEGSSSKAEGGSSKAEGGSSKAEGRSSKAEAEACWRLERLRPNGRMDWLPAGPAPLLAQAATLETLAGSALPSPLAPVAAFHGRRRVLKLDAARGVTQLSVLDGTLRGIALDRPACRVILEGAAGAAADLACELAQTVRLSVPRAGLAAQAIAVARGTQTPPRHSGTPSIPPGLSLDDAIALAMAHLADVVLHWASLVPGAATPQPVHQMRVGVRRLRSALSVFRRAVQDEAGQVPWLDSLACDLKRLAGRLGAARDWDVFLGETGAEIGRTFAGDRRIATLLAASERRRAAAYEDLAAGFAAHDWTRLELTIALLPTRRPWRSAGAAQLDMPLRDYAAHALDRRLRHVLLPGETLDTLGAHDLHAVRKQAKRLRYATEFFAPLFAEKQVRKYLPRLEELQEVLGTVNDRDVAASLMAQLGGGADRAFAAGVVQGFTAASSLRHAGRVRRAWSKFRGTAPFWD